MKKSHLHLVALVASHLWTAGTALAAPTPEIIPKGAPTGVPILLYHRFGPTVADSMTVTTAVFEAHLRYLKENGYTVIPLRQLVDSYSGRAAVPPPRSVVIVADDAHGSVYTDMLPLVKKYRVPVTLFVYPSAVSNASYAMNWDQLRELKRTGLFDVQSHTFWHPNFKVEKRRLKPGDYEKLVDAQLRKSRERLERELGGPVDLLAWPFGIWDDHLLERAAAAGYRATFTIVARAALPTDPVMKLPRFLLSNADQGKAFSRLLGGSPETDQISRRAPPKADRRTRRG